MVKFLVCAVLCGSLLSGCGLVKKLFGSKPKAVPQAREVRLAGRVEKVDTARGYVLIRRYGPWRFDPAGEVAESRAAGRTANLYPTGERLGEHVAADIRSGAVEVGDAVYIRQTKVSRKPKPSPEPEKPGTSDNQPETAGNP